MQARIRKWHQNAAAQKSDFIIAPVGDAWELNYKNPKAVRLHAADNSHPAFNGSYLAALVIYGTIYFPSDLNVAYHGDLGHAETLYLQGIATQATRMSFCRERTRSFIPAGHPRSLISARQAGELESSAVPLKIRAPGLAGHPSFLPSPDFREISGLRGQRRGIGWGQGWPERWLKPRNPARSTDRVASTISGLSW